MVEESKIVNWQCKMNNYPKICINHRGAQIFTDYVRIFKDMGFHLLGEILSLDF